MANGIDKFKPHLILSPMLKAAIPENIWWAYKCLILHPGIKGDRGPSSLDWVIKENKKEWGVTVVEAHNIMDHGDIWDTRNFMFK